MSPPAERQLSWLYVESLVILAMLFPNRRDAATDRFLHALPAVVKRPPGLAPTLPLARDVVAEVKAARPTAASQIARFRALVSTLTRALDGDALQQWRNQARYIIGLGSDALWHVEEALRAVVPPETAALEALELWPPPPVAHPLDRHGARSGSSSAGRQRHRRRRHHARWVPAIVALACAAGAAAWFHGRDFVLPSKHLAELTEGCSVHDALGNPIWFGPTALPPSSRLSRAEVCDVGQALASKTQEFLRVRVAQICDSTTDVVTHRFGGDYSAAMASAQRMAAAGDANAARAYAALARCRTDEARAGLVDDVRRELATTGIRYGVYSVGQFMVDGRTCSGYIEQARIESKSARARTPDTRYGLSGLGDCAGFRFAPEGLFDLARRLEGPLPGDFIRQAFRYDGTLPETWTLGGRGYNFVSSGVDGQGRAVAAGDSPSLVRPPLDAPEGDVLKAFRELERYEGRRLRDMLVDPGLASAIWAVIPRGFESCAIKLADSVGPFRGTPDGALVFDSRPQRDGGKVVAAAYFHPAGIVHLGIDVAGCGRSVPAIAYFTAADPTGLRPIAMDDWLRAARTLGIDAYWETDAGRRPLVLAR